MFIAIINFIRVMFCTAMRYTPWPDIDNLPKCTIYCLELTDNKYYVGKTTDHKTRIDQHFKGNGCSWTQKHKPIRLHAIKYDCDSFDEDKYLKITMAKYGILNVRGGSYSTLFFDANTMNLLEKEINGSLDKCFKCGKHHFAKDCAKLIYKKCNRCGRTTHIANQCYAKIDINGNSLKII